MKAQYHIEFKKDGESVGLVACSRLGVELIDFYRTQAVLASQTARPVRICIDCKQEIPGTWAYTVKLNPICQGCARKRADGSGSYRSDT